jgi:hypothetical protein
LFSFSLYHFAHLCTCLHRSSNFRLLPYPPCF